MQKLQQTKKKYKFNTETAILNQNCTAWRSILSARIFFTESIYEVRGADIFIETLNRCGFHYFTLFYIIPFAMFYVECNVTYRYLKLSKN